MRSELYANGTSQYRQELVIIPKWMTERKSQKKAAAMGRFSFSRVKTNV
jgi:hypothetical protein